VSGPVKAALDVLRDIRNTVRRAVDYGGLLPASYREDFLGRYVPLNALLSAGPPIERVEALKALIEGGVVEVVGPRMLVEADEGRGVFTLSSPDVAGSLREVTAVVDARIPQPDLRGDRSPLYRRMLARGTVREFVRRDPRTGEVLHTGGVEVTTAPFQVLGAGGYPVPGLYALGLPTEHLRWFTQVGSGRPRLRTLFQRDADAIAEHLLRPLPGRPHRPTGTADLASAR